MGCIGIIKSISNARTDEKLQFNRFDDICEEHCMIQVLEEATRNENTLDLVYTNYIRMVANIDVNTSAISVHNKIEITTTYRIKEKIIKLIKEIPWRNICKNGKAIEVIECLLEKLN